MTKQTPKKFGRTMLEGLLDRKTHQVTVHGMLFNLRELTDAQSAEAAGLMCNEKGQVDPGKVGAMRAASIAFAVVDDDGNQIMTRDEASGLLPGLAQDLFRKIDEISSDEHAGN